MSSGTLGIVITKYENLEHISGVTKAARAASHRVRIFMNDEGVRFTRDPKFLALLADDGVEISVCEYSCDQLRIHERAAGVTYGSQYDHAGMVHASERVLVF